ncbi:hypothetical protein CUJ83_04450 [Methanocella sp. CWC-04]|uniref:4-vinyl reductase 4VR domain-containing protein n=1 Tax=Methanooceanicella nereidis TaxID=2052831 RepID=A0AAP2RC59_9EURY|nr:4-vinyl reductase [Methanocella sp. CWC-04]MCD1294246.1 hypothetical protein [Methanocella sp. CWC-04]
MTIDKKKIVDTVRSIKLEEGKDGLIKIFGVYLTFMYTDFYNDFSYEFLFSAEKEIGEYAIESIEGLLIHAAQECGLETMNAVMQSQEWRSIVEPLISTSNDRVEAIVEIVNAFGWGNVHVKSLVPGEELTLIAYDSYEANGYLKEYGRSDRPRCYMLRGVAGSIMDLVYGDRPFPLNLETYQAVQTKCITMGDEYSEFYVTKV